MTTYSGTGRTAMARGPVGTGITWVCRGLGYAVGGLLRAVLWRF